MQKHTYVVAEGISTINGKAVPSSREIDLTEREALFDLSLDRIALKKQVAVSKPASRKAKSHSDVDQQVDTDQGDEADEA